MYGFTAVEDGLNTYKLISLMSTYIVPLEDQIGSTFQFRMNKKNYKIILYDISRDFDKINVESLKYMADYLEIPERYTMSKEELIQELKIRIIFEKSSAPPS
jgi:hypothetical protein